MSTQLIISPAPELQPSPLFTPTPKAAKRVLEFFTAQINNDHTRKAYLNATRRFAAWCDTRGIGHLADVEPFHVAAFVKDLQSESSRAHHRCSVEGCPCRSGRFRQFNPLISCRQRGLQGISKKERFDEMLVAFPITTVVAFQSFNGMRITTPPIVSPNSKLSRGLSRVSIACARRGQRRPHSALAYQPPAPEAKLPKQVTSAAWPRFVVG